MPTYKIDADVQIERNIQADDPDAALEKFYDMLDETDLAYEVNRYKVYEL